MAAKASGERLGAGLLLHSDGAVGDSGSVPSSPKLRVLSSMGKLHVADTGPIAGESVGYLQSKQSGSLLNGSLRVATLWEILHVRVSIQAA